MRFPTFCGKLIQLATVAASVSASGSLFGQLDLTGSLVLAEQGGSIEAGNLGTLAGTTAFTNGDLGDTLSLAFHQDFNLNDGVAGNGNSWIGDFTQPPEPNTAPSFGGVAFAAPQTVQSFAFGRDNTGGFSDRTLGLYSLQWTQAASPGVGTIDTGDPSTGWATVGTLNYGAPDPAINYTAPSLRHRYNFDQVSGATGFRLITPGGAAIDELEFYSVSAIVQPPPSPIAIAPASGFNISWNGNDGDFFDPTAPPAGAMAPGNLATTIGTAFGSSEFGGGGAHLIANVNDGTYGNSNSWIANFSAGDPNPTIGIDLGTTVGITSFAFGRDNGNGAIDDSDAGSDACGGQCDDRAFGLYTIEITTDGNTWQPLGTIDYQFGVDDEVGGGFTEYLRHEFEISTASGDPVLASGLRILVPNNGIAIDEIEIYAIPEPSGVAMLLVGCAALLLSLIHI